MTKFAEGKIPYFSKLKYLSADEQAEGVAILERAKDNRDKIMFDRFQLKNIQRSIEYTEGRLVDLKKEELQHKIAIAIDWGDNVVEEDNESAVEDTEEVSESNATDVLTGDLYGYGVPDYESGDDEDNGDEPEDLI